MAPFGPGVATDANICKQYTPLVEGMVRRLHVPDALQDDARQEGFIGLLAAVRKYDVKSPVHFSVFAGPYVKGAILRRIYTRTQVTETATDNPGAGDPTVSGAYEVENEVVLGVQLEAWMASLPLADAWILKRIYWDDADTNDIAAELGITRRRVNQRHAEILRRGALALGDGE
jgi:RNA polymerase sigma factor (sigma-70 family)